MSETWKPQRIRELEQYLTERDVLILLDLERFRLLTTSQIQRLHFGASPLGPHTSALAGTRASIRVLGRLDALHVVGRLSRRVGGPKHGSSATIWQLAPAGERYLRALRGDPDRRKFQEPGPAFVFHTLDVADIAVRLLERAQLGHFEVLEIETEPTCWRVFQAGGGVQTLKPDLLAVTADVDTETHSFIEVDRGTEHMPAIRRKSALYQRYYRDGTEDRTRGLYPAVVWIVPDRFRADRVREAIRDDPTLESELFTVVTTGEALSPLAPYGPTEPSLPS